MPPMSDGGDPDQLASLIPFAAHLGIEILEAAPASVRGRVAWGPELCTTAGVMHGGVLMSLGDTLGATCAFLNLPSGATTATIESKTNFFRPVTEGYVEGVARPLHVGRAVIVVQTDLTDGAARSVGQVTQTQAVRLPAQ
jgi:1,4-dihydroxy-2-naphthoyl-CoA hydrolase